MPLYDFQCELCGEEFEEVYKIDERHLAKCPACNGPVKQLMSPSKKDWFRPHWNENITTEPVFVESKEHYKELCKKHGYFHRGKYYARCL